MCVPPDLERETLELSLSLQVDSEFLREQALDSVVEDSQLSESTQAQFEYAIFCSSPFRHIQIISAVDSPTSRQPDRSARAFVDPALLDRKSVV